VRLNQAVHGFGELIEIGKGLFFGLVDGEAEGRSVLEKGDGYHDNLRQKNQQTPDENKFEL
jgi:hypothetical protein